MIFEEKMYKWSIELMRRLILLHLLIPVQDPTGIYLVSRNKFLDLINEGVIKWENTNSISSLETL